MDADSGEYVQGFKETMVGMRFENSQCEEGVEHYKRKKKVKKLSPPSIPSVLKVQEDQSMFDPVATPVKTGRPDVEEEFKEEHAWGEEGTHEFSVSEFEVERDIFCLDESDENMFDPLRGHVECAKASLKVFLFSCVGYTFT